MAKPDVHGTQRAPAAPLSEEALETSKLLVEFLHAAYATRRSPVPAGDATSSPDAPPRGAALDAAPESRPLHGPEDGPGTAPISPHAIRAAIHIYQHGSRTVGQIASGLGISYGWASRVVDELEAAGYLVRERDEGDRRIVRVRLQAAATDEVEQAYRWRGDVVERALAPLSPAEREAVRGFLRRVVDGLGAGGTRDA